MKREFSTVSVYNNNGNTVRVTETKHETDTQLEIMKLRMAFFNAELTLLSQKYGVAIHGQIHFADFDKVAYSADIENGELRYTYTLKNQ